MLTGAVVALAVGMWGKASSALSHMSTALRHFARAVHVRVWDDTSEAISTEVSSPTRTCTALAKWRRAVDMWDNAEEALPHMPTARATTAPVSIYDLVHPGPINPQILRTRPFLFSKMHRSVSNAYCRDRGVSDRLLALACCQ